MYRADIPENARLFILAGKGIKEETFREKFEHYGKIEDLWIVKDKRTNEDKGVVYITYSKTSEAAQALEEMNGKILPGNPRPLKVLVANTKRDGSVRDPREDERLTRLFVIIPKSFKEDDLTKAFEEFGDVASVNVLRDKDSGQAKGFGFVKFHRPYHAALALENCDKSFKPKFAEPKKSQQESADKYDRESYSRSSRYDDRDDRDRHDRRGAPGGYPYDDRDRGLKRSRDDYYDHDRDSRRRDRRDDFLSDDGRSRYSAHARSPPPRFEPPMPQGQSPLDMIQDYPHTNCQRLHVTAPVGLTQNYLHKLFNLIPGIEYCDLNEQTGVAYVRYQSPQCAAYARDRLDQFEYPIGSRLVVRYADNTSMGNPDYRAGFDSMPGSYRSSGNNVSGAVHQAAKVLEQAGINPDLVLQSPPSGGGGDGTLERVTYCNIKLPLPKPMLGEETPTARRLFIVCQPASVPERILRDAFSRFGGLIEVYLLPKRNFGYAKYATEESALNAIRCLHGQTMAGQRLKVLEAEPNKKEEEEDNIKRQRTEMQY